MALSSFAATARFMSRSIALQRTVAARCLRSQLMQSEQKGSTQQIADYKDQLSNNRARTKDSKGNEQQVLVQVSARITADRRSISL